MHEQEIKANGILGLRMDGTWIEDVGRIKAEVSSHFKWRFNGDIWQRPALDGIHFNRILGDQCNMLTADFSLLEIEAAVWNYDNNKSPGLDRFNFMFIKKFWSLLRDDVCKLFAEFHKN